MGNSPDPKCNHVLHWCDVLIMINKPACFSFYLVPLSFPLSHPGHHDEVDHHVSLGSSEVQHFLDLSLFWAIKSFLYERRFVQYFPYDSTGVSDEDREISEVNTLLCHMAVKVYSMVYHCWYQTLFDQRKRLPCFPWQVISTLLLSMLFAVHDTMSGCHNMHSVCKEWEAVFLPWVLSSSVTETSFSKLICVSPTPSSLVNCLCQYRLVGMVLYTVLQCFLAWSQRLFQLAAPFTWLITFDGCVL